MRKVSYGWITRACQLEVERRILLCETSLPRRTYHAIPFSPTMRCSLCRWAYGIVLIEVLQDGNSPYAQLLNSEVLAKVPRGYRCPQPLGCPDEVYALLIEKCWNVDPHLRADFTTVVELLENIEYTMVNRKMWTMPGSGEEYQVLAEIEEEIVHEPPSREYSISGDMKDDRNDQCPTCGRAPSRSQSEMVPKISESDYATMRNTLRNIPESHYVPLSQVRKAEPVYTASGNIITARVYSDPESQYVPLSQVQTTEAVYTVSGDIISTQRQESKLESTQAFYSSISQTSDASIFGEPVILNGSSQRLYSAGGGWSV
jgi:hypothetical protein